MLCGIIFGLWYPLPLNQTSFMKKKIFSTLIFSSFFASSFAEIDADAPAIKTAYQTIRIGGYLAPTISWMRASAAKDGAKAQENGGAKMGFTYGLMGDFHFAENYAVATGIQVNSTGGKINTTNPSAIKGEVSRSSFNYTVQYVEIPVALKLKTDRMGKFSIFGQAGMTIGFNISKKMTYEMTVADTGSSSKNYIVGEKEKINGGIGNIAPILFQMNIGAGVQYNIGQKVDAYAGIFFNNGFAPNATNPSRISNIPASFTDGNTRLNNFALRLGFYF